MQSAVGLEQEEGLQLQGPADTQRDTMQLQELDTMGTVKTAQQYTASWLAAGLMGLVICGMIKQI